MSVESKKAVGPQGKEVPAGPESEWVEGREGRSRCQPPGMPRIEILEAARELAMPLGLVG